MQAVQNAVPNIGFSGEWRYFVKKGKATLDEVALQVRFCQSIAHGSRLERGKSQWEIVSVRQTQGNKNSPHLRKIESIVFMVFLLAYPA